MIRLDHVSKIYGVGDSKVYALNDVSIEIKQGEFVAIMGSSGSGKSTLLNIIGLLDLPDKGQFYLNDKEISQYTEDDLSNIRSQLIGFIFQQFNLLKRTSAYDNVALPHLYFQSKNKIDPTDALSIVNLADRAQHLSNELSGGQQQRVAIARSLVNNPIILFADEPTGNLDSKSEKEILDIILDLHAKGITVIMVTHEDHISEIAERVIRMKDGKIISDTKRKGAIDHNQPTQQLNLTPRTPIDLGYIINSFHMGLKTLLMNKARTALSMLGILIGVAAVIAMLAIGNGAQKSIGKQFESLGSNVLTLSPGAMHFGPVKVDMGEVTRFKPDDIEAIRASLHTADGVTGVVMEQARLIYENSNWSTNVTGADEYYKNVNNLSLKQGRFFNQEENKQRKRVAILGLTVVDKLFAGQNPVGKTIKIGRARFQIIGVLKEQGSSGFRDEDDIAIIPLETAMKRVMGKEYLSNIQVRVKDERNLSAVEKSLNKFVIKHKKLTKDQHESFNIRNMTGIRDAFTGTINVISYLLAIVAAISLIVGGIGIMNIMLVSVTERTREIGLRKAIGASRQDILIQFLVESIIVSLIGGLLGIFLGVSLSLIVSLLTGWATSVSINSIVISVLFSVFTGILFGIWPARKASLFKPIDALRFE